MSGMKIRRDRGDTIIEVLIAIAVASFAIGTSYALANKSLQNAITAGDRNQALNIIQNQIADLKIRHAVYNDEDSFNADFGVPSSVDGPPYPHQARWFCLTDGIVTRNSPNWGPHDNTAISSESAASSLGNYVAACVQGDFHINVTAEITRTSELTSNHTIFKVTVRWPQFSGQAPGSAVAYYRLNKAAAATPGTPNASPAPAPSPSPTPPPSGGFSGDANFNQNSGGQRSQTFTYSKLFTNSSSNDPSKVTGCTWNWGDGTTTRNTACIAGNQLTHPFSYPPYSPNKLPPCRKLFTVTLTVFVSSGSPGTHTDTILIPRGAQANNLPAC